MDKEPFRKGKEHEHIHHPEFILIEEEQSGRQGHGYRRESPDFASFEELSTVHFPFSIRIAALGLSFLMLMSVVASLAALILTGSGVAATLGLSRKVVDLFHKCLGWLRKAAVLSMGFFVAVFSPSFGFAIIIIYFLLLGEKINHDILKRMLQSASK